MKNIIYTLAALFSIAIASAQTDTSNTGGIPSSSARVRTERTDPTQITPEAQKDTATVKSTEVETVPEQNNSSAPSGRNPATVTPRREPKD